MTDTGWRSFVFDLAARADGSPDNIVPAVLSTDAPVRMQVGEEAVDEILDHSPESVDTSRFPLPVVEDHDNAKTAIAVAEEPRLEGGKLRALIRFGSQGRAKEILADVKAGIVRSLSIFYERGRAVREGERTYRTTKWTPVHVSPVGGPADAGAGFFRSQPNHKPPTVAPVKDPVMADQPTPDKKPDAPALDATALRAEAKEIAGIARSLNLPADDFVGLTKQDATTAMLKAVAERSTKEKPEPTAPALTISMDHADKQVQAFTDALAARAQVSKPVAGNPYNGRGLLEMAQRYAKSVGIRAADDWSRKDAAHFVLGEHSLVTGMREAANITTGNFTSFVMLDAITKIIAKGYEMVPKGLVGQSGDPIYDTQTVPDFKSFRIGGLGTANLFETPENTPFLELDKYEGVYSDTAKMWGGTLSLTIQALISDDTASFERSLRMSPVIAQKTKEKRIIQKLLMGTSASTGTSTWTSNTTSGSTPVFTTADTVAAARANIGKPNAALQTKTGLDGNPTGNTARFIVTGPTAGQYVSALLNQAPGQIVANAPGMFEHVVSPWLENSSLTGYSTTTYYEICDPLMVTGLVLSLVGGYEALQVQEYDAGAVGARKWKVWQPFEADLFYFTTTDGSTKVIPGAQQATT